MSLRSKMVIVFKTHSYRY